MKKSIKLEVSLDKEQLPEQIEWSASDSPSKNKQICKAFLLEWICGLIKCKLMK